jgi:uncharacterized RDD family membrane protein YckC
MSEIPPGYQHQGDAHQQPQGEPLQDQPLPPAPPVPDEYGYGQYGDVPVPPGMYVHQDSGLLLPEGTTLATHGRRIGAFFLAIPLSIVTLGIGYIIWGIIAWTQGTTPALQVLGMRCWRPEDKRVPGFWWMVLREVIGRLCEGILSIITELASFIMFLASRERKALHDYVAGTVVLHDPNKVLPR